jgi:multidrug transporter EmrE-like cation transporter
MEMDELSYGNIWKAVAVAVAVDVVGMFLLRHSDEGRQAIAVLGLVVGIVVLHILDHRELRRKGLEAPGHRRVG